MVTVGMVIPKYISDKNDGRNGCNDGGDESSTTWWVSSVDLLTLPPPPTVAFPCLYLQVVILTGASFQMVPWRLKWIQHLQDERKSKQETPLSWPVHPLRSLHYTNAATGCFRKHHKYESRDSVRTFLLFASIVTFISSASMNITAYH